VAFLYFKGHCGKGALFVGFSPNIQCNLKVLIWLFMRLYDPEVNFNLKSITFIHLRIVKCLILYILHIYIFLSGFVYSYQAPCGFERNLKNVEYTTV